LAHRFDFVEKIILCGFLTRRKFMNTLQGIAPNVRERQCGGWLAVSEANADLKIGVTADTEAGARAAFASALIKWEKILKSEPGR
jgi:hypothetical protein